MTTTSSGIRYASVALMIFMSATLLTTLASAQRVGRRVAGASTAGKRVPAKRSPKRIDGDEIKGVTTIGEMGIQRVNTEVQQTMLFAPRSMRPPLKPERETRDKDNPKAQNLFAPAVATWPGPAKMARHAMPSVATSPAIHTLSNAFDGATLTDTGAFPPDSMGTVGPTQYVAFENGRIRSFTKTGTADGVLNADPDVFFASVMTPVGGSVVLNFTSDPQVRYDRFTGRWYMSIIDVPCTNATCTTTAVNRWMVAVSDAASGGTISGSTVWTFFFFSADASGDFCDYPSLGVDVNALYVGCSIFSGTGTFVGTNGYVVQKTSILGAGPIVTTAFPGLVVGAGAGPESPRGVDNFDPGATEGYFVGPDNATFSTIMFRRVSNPGSLAPTISANIPVTVPTTTISPANYLGVDHLGNTGGANGRLDGIDDRFFQAMIRNGRLWSAQNFTVSNAGVANTAAQSRWAARWYEFQNLTTTPTLVQSGTVFDNLATRAGATTYTMPSVVVTGQGHAILGATMAGTTTGATPVFVGRLSGDTLGTMTGPPTVAAVPFGTSTGNYNPPADPGGPRRWGDYSFTVVDPIDDMTVWTIQEYNQALNSYAVRVAKLLAPPPAAPTSAFPAGVPGGLAHSTITITGTSSSGSGFYDPGTNLAPPARPFTHISASVSGGVTVNSVTYTDPTHVTLNISTVGAATGPHNVTITNPDGQSVTVNGLITVNGTTAAPADISGRITDAFGNGIRGARISIVDTAGRSRVATTNAFGYYVFADVPTGFDYFVTPTVKGYTFSPASVLYRHVDTMAGLNFAATSSSR